MKITITKEHIAKARLNLPRFKSMVKKDLNLEKSFFENSTLVECTIKDQDKIMELIFRSTDWGNLLLLFDVAEHEYMDLHVFECKIEGMTSYKPISINKEAGIVKLEPITEIRTEFLVVNSFNKRFEKHIEYMLGQTLVDYVKYGWKWEYDVN